MQDDGASEEGGEAESLRPDFLQAVAELQRRGQEDLERLAALGRDCASRYHYTMVLDSDTVCPPLSIRRLVETAEHEENERFGIINANLANDYADESAGCTWHMWRSALMEVSTVDLQRGQFWVYDRVGFYGKGLVRNDMYIERIIGTPGNVLEALPVDILSHDTVEAKLLQPAIAPEVTLYEAVARNPISGMAQSTRWLFGEVRNGCYHDGGYKFMVNTASQLHSLCSRRKALEKPYVRWADVPCSASAAYLSHLGMRIFHAGPALLLYNLLSTVLAQFDWGLEINTSNRWLGGSMLLFVFSVLFVLPKVFLIVDKLPSFGLRAACCRTRRFTKVKQGSGSDEEAADMHLTTPGPPFSADEEECDEEPSSQSSAEESEGGLQEDSVRRPLDGRGCHQRLCMQLGLGMIEVGLSFLLYCPELVLGCIRLFQGIRAQVTGQQTWVPQDAVEKEVEDNLSLGYIFKETRVVFLCGLAYLAYYFSAGLDSVGAWFLVVPWVLYPITTYALCLKVPAAYKDRWIWAWVMDLKYSQAAARSGT